MICRDISVRRMMKPAVVVVEPVQLIGPLLFFRIGRYWLQRGAGRAGFLRWVVVSAVLTGLTASFRPTPLRGADLREVAGGAGLRRWIAAARVFIARGRPLPCRSSFHAGINSLPKVIDSGAGN